MTDNYLMADRHFAELLATAFIVLKLTGHIDWSWWWVLSPFWILAIVTMAFELARQSDLHRRNKHD